MKLKNAFLAAVIAIATTACQAVSTQLPPLCSVQDLLVGESVFQGDITRGLPSKNLAPTRFGVDKIGVGFGTMAGEGGALQDVYLGGSERSAQKEFDDWAKWKFSQREGWTEWYTPDSFDYQSSVADQYRFSCSRYIASNAETCQSIGRYGPYLIRFHANMSSAFTYRDLEHGLRAIDAHAAQCLRK